MGPAFYIIAILGCGDGQAACEQVRVEQTRYASADACNAATNGTLMNATDLAYPEVMAECRPASKALAGKATPPRG